jgi:hypothetical protein
MVLRCRFALIRKSFYKGNRSKISIFGRIPALRRSRALRGSVLSRSGPGPTVRVCEGVWHHQDRLHYIWGIGVRHPPLPLVYSTLPVLPLAPLPVRVVHSRRSLFMQMSGIVRTGCTIYGDRGQTSPTAPGIQYPAPHPSRPAPCSCGSFAQFPIRMVHSRRSLFMQVSGIVRTGYTIYGDRGQTSPTTPGILCSPPLPC